MKLINKLLPSKNKEKKDAPNVDPKALGSLQRVRSELENAVGLSPLPSPEKQPIMTSLPPLPKPTAVQQLLETINTGTPAHLQEDIKTTPGSNMQHTANDVDLSRPVPDTPLMQHVLRMGEETWWNELPELAVEAEQLREYRKWVKDIAHAIKEKNKTLNIWLHPKRGGVYYLQPIGMYFFPRVCFTHVGKPSQYVRVGTHGTCIWTSHCNSKEELIAFMSEHVRRK